MHLKIDPSDATPVYAQLMRQIKFLVASRTLRPGDQVPTVRELALQQAINPNTVLKVYRELEHEGVLVSRKGSGTYVAEKVTVLRESARLEIVAQHCRGLASEAVTLGIDLPPLQELLAREYQAIAGAGPESGGGSRPQEKRA